LLRLSCDPVHVLSEDYSLLKVTSYKMYKPGD
jgi:hypothetical protein